MMAVSSTMEERVGRLEGINEQIRDRLNSIDGRFEQIDRRFEQIDRRFESIDRRFDGMELRFDRIDQRFMWLTGVLIGTWITTILTILFHH
ncbi:MAG: hypothetical protein JO263_06955 [Candidatus Eremiobacteraeota bacterium]|nr:hypothetical protein [Candidatus Eremiobacteraeota bacterium]